MRWVFAGLAFALLVALAVFTVAIKANNIEARRRIARQGEELMALEVEVARRVRDRTKSATTEELKQQLLEFLLEARGAQQ